MFDFLGFTHYCTRSRKWGSFVIGRKTIKKRMLRTLEAIKVELRKRMHDPIVKTGAWVWQMLNGYLNYFAVPGNDKSLWWFWNEIRWRWLRTRYSRGFLALPAWSPPLRAVRPRSRSVQFDLNKCGCVTRSIMRPMRMDFERSEIAAGQAYLELVVRGCSGCGFADG